MRAVHDELATDGLAPSEPNPENAVKDLVSFLPVLAYDGANMTQIDAGGILEPEFEEVVTGEAEVREIFRVPRVGAVAGCMVTNGQITRGSKVRFLREGTIIWKGTVQSLRRFKDDAREVAAGYECGIGLSDFQDLKQAQMQQYMHDSIVVPEELQSNVLDSTVDKVYNWSRKSSMWPLLFGLACCAIEMIATAASCAVARTR